MRGMAAWSGAMVVGLLLTSGCPGARSKESVREGAMPSAESPSAFCEVVARLRCQGRADCCADAAPCDAAQELDDCRGYMERAIINGKARYDRATAERVLAHWAGWTERCEARFWDLAPNIWWLVGLVPEGGDCLDDTPDHNSQDMYCVQGLQCVDGRCAKPAALGESCSFQHPCVAGVSCQRDRCAPLKPAGATCEGAHECQTAVCRAGKCDDYTFLTDRWFCR